jgi:hypothetical protein
MVKKAGKLRRIASCIIVALLFLSFFVFAFIVLSAKAQSGGAYLISTTDDYYSTSGDSQHHIVTTSTGKIYAIYTRSPNVQSPTVTELYVQCSPDGGKTWVNETLLSNLAIMSGRYAEWGSIAVDSNNNLYVVFPAYTSSNPNYYQIWYTMSTNGATWTTPVVISTGVTATTDQRGPALAIDSNNNLHVVWYGYSTTYTTTYQIWEVDCISGTWDTPTMISTINGTAMTGSKWPCIVTDSNNNLDVFFRGTTATQTYSATWFTARISGTWSTPRLISTYSGMNTQNQISPVLAIDSNNVIYAGWWGNATGYSNSQEWIATCSGGTWDTPVRISTYPGMANYPQGDSAIAVDTTNRVYVLWEGEATGYSDYNKIWEANYSNGVWSTPQVLQSIGHNFCVNVQWNTYPSFDIPKTQVNYIFTNGTSSPFNVMFASMTVSSPSVGEFGSWWGGWWIVLGIGSGSVIVLLSKKMRAQVRFSCRILMGLPRFRLRSPGD